MTTIVFSRAHGQISADSRNTDSSGAATDVYKIERLKDGRYFLGSGHLLTIGKTKRWAEKHFAEKYRPEYGELFTECAEEFRFSCLVVSSDGEHVTLIDDEMEPQAVVSDFAAVGTGGAYALGALHAGATPAEAVAIAIRLDGYSGGLVCTETLYRGLKE